MKIRKLIASPTNYVVEIDGLVYLLESTYKGFINATREDGINALVPCGLLFTTDDGFAEYHDNIFNSKELTKGFIRQFKSLSSTKEDTVSFETPTGVFEFNKRYNYDIVVRDSSRKGNFTVFDLEPVKDRFSFMIFTDGSKECPIKKDLIVSISPRIENNKKVFNRIAKLV